MPVVAWLGTENSYLDNEALQLAPFDVVRDFSVVLNALYNPADMGTHPMDRLADENGFLINEVLALGSGVTSFPFSLNCDSLRTVVESFSLDADGLRTVVSSLAVSADSLRTVVESFSVEGDSRRTVHQSFSEAADSLRTVVAGASVIADGLRTLIQPFTVEGDGLRIVGESGSVSADSLRTVIQTFSEATDALRVLIHPFAVDADSFRQVVQSFEQWNDSFRYVIECLTQLFGAVILGQGTSPTATGIVGIGGVGSGQIVLQKECWQPIAKQPVTIPWPLWFAPVRVQVSLDADSSGVVTLPFPKLTDIFGEEVPRGNGFGGQVVVSAHRQNLTNPITVRLDTNDAHGDLAGLKLVSFPAEQRLFSFTCEAYFATLLKLTVNNAGGNPDVVTLTVGVQ